MTPWAFIAKKMVNGPIPPIRTTLTKEGDDLMIRIRDDGVAFDPTQYQPGDEEEMRFHGIEVVRKVAKEFNYLRVLNMNNTIMEIGLAK